MPEPTSENEEPDALFAVAADALRRVEDAPVVSVLLFPAVTRLPELPSNRPDEVVDAPLAPVDPGAALFEYVPDKPRRRAKVTQLPTASKSRNTRTPKSPEEDARGKLANELAKVYTRRVKLSKFTAVASVVCKALEDDWTPEEIEAALGRLADKKTNVTVGTMQYELNTHAARASNRPKFDPKVRRSGKPLDTAVYRFYDEDNVLLYVGQTPAPIERFHEHRDDKPWFDEVTHFSTDWHLSREDAEWAEDAAIADEWPLYNKKGQPRDTGAGRIPSYMAGVLKQVIREAIEAAIPEACPEQAQAALDYVSDAFSVNHHPDADLITCGMWFGESKAPTDFYPMDLNQAREDFGPYRAPVDGSTRVPRNTLPPTEEEAS